MVDATLSRGGTSVAIPLVEESGTPLISRDLGKPNQQIHSSGRPNPRVQDQWSGLSQYRLIGTFDGSSAFQDARTLQDLIKSHSGGNDLTMDIPLSDFDSNIPVAPAAEQEQACTITYEPGRTDWCGVEVTLTRISETLGSGTQSASTPTGSGAGPITLDDGSRTIEITASPTVERTVGRPNSTVRRQIANFPKYIDHRKAAYDAIDLSFRLADSNAITDTQNIVDMFENRLGRSTLTLDFQGLYGLGQFSVVPRGSQALRTVRVAGEEGQNRVPTVSLRRVMS